jgi:hypothetical protein
MNAIERPRLNANGTRFATGLGVLFGGLTLAIERLSTIPDNRLVGAAQKTLLILISPGIIGAMGIGGNVHSWPLWAAAAINGVIYFGIGWFFFVLAVKYRNRGRLLAALGAGDRRASESRSDGVH